MKTLLALSILIPLNSFAEVSETKYSDWTYSLIIDDFTDVKTHLAQTINDLDIALGILIREPALYTIMLKFNGYYCDSNSKKEIPVLFRVDKNEVKSFVMHPKDDDRTHLILKPGEDNDGLGKLLNLQFEMMDGNILKIRVEDSKCEYSSIGRLDTEFSLDGFTKAFEPLLKTQLGLI